MVFKAVRDMIGARALVRETLKRPFKFNIDIVDACNLRCVNCPRGVNSKNSTSHRMELETFKRILDKITSECRCETVELYNWTEPFLHPELDKFVGEVKSRKIGCVLSSNMSLDRPELLESVMARSPALIVSVSGFEQETHELYHKGSRVERVKANLKAIAAIKEKHGIRSRVEVHCLQFVDNLKDQEMWKLFCDDHGFIFVAKPAGGLGVLTRDNIKRLINVPEFEELPDGSLRAVKRYAKEPLFDHCRLHNQVPLDSRGDVYLCCIYWNDKESRVCGYLDYSLEYIQRKRLSRFNCAHCKGMRTPGGG